MDDLFVEMPGALISKSYVKGGYVPVQQLSRGQRITLKRTLTSRKSNRQYMDKYGAYITNRATNKRNGIDVVTGVAIGGPAKRLPNGMITDAARRLRRRGYNTPRDKTQFAVDMGRVAPRRVFNTKLSDTEKKTTSFAKAPRRGGIHQTRSSRRVGQ